MPIVTTKPGSKAVVRVTGATTETFQPSDFHANTTQLQITKVYWSGNTTIARGANTILSLTGSGAWDLTGAAMTLTEFPAANLSITTVAGSSALVEVTQLPSAAA